MHAHSEVNLERRRRVRPRSDWLLATVLVLAAAAPIRAQSYRTSLPGYGGSILMDSLTQDSVLKASPGVVYAATLAAFKQLGIAVTVADSAGGVIANGGFSAMHALAGSLMSREFECGQGAVGPYADAFDMHIAIAVLLRPVPSGGTKLGIAVAASASDVSGAFRDPKFCHSTGALEAKMLTTIMKRTQ